MFKRFQILCCHISQTRWRFVLLGILSCIWISACTPSSSIQSSVPSNTNNPGCRIVEHEAGETEVCGQPQRIAVLSPHILDQVLALGAQPIAYAESVALSLERFDHPREQIPHLGDRITTQPVNLGDRKAPSLEKLAQLKPDLILSEDWLVQDKYPLLSQIAPTLLFTDEKEGQQHWTNNIEGIAAALGREAEAQQVLANFSTQLEEARQTLAPVVAAYSKVLILSVNTSMSDVAIAADSTAGHLLEEIGFHLVFPESVPAGEMRWLQTSLEVLPTLDADIVLVIGWDASNLYNPEERLKQQWNQIPILQTLPAAKADRIFFVDYQLWGSITRGPITDELILQKLPEMFLPLTSNH